MHNNISSGAWVRVVFASANKYEIRRVAVASDEQILSKVCFGKMITGMIENSGLAARQGRTIQQTNGTFLSCKEDLLLKFCANFISDI